MCVYDSLDVFTALAVLFRGCAYDKFVVFVCVYDSLYGFGALAVLFRGCDGHASFDETF